MESNSVCKHRSDKKSGRPLILNNGNRTEWSSIRSVIIRTINKIRQFEAEVRFVNHEYDYRQNWTTSHKTNTFRTNISGTDNVLSKKFLHFENSLAFFLFFFRISGCCYGYCDQFSDWWSKLNGPNMIGCFNCPITGIRLQPTVQ